MTLLDAKARQKYGMPDGVCYMTVDINSGAPMTKGLELVVQYGLLTQFVMQFVWSAKPGQGWSEEWMTYICDFPGC